MNLWGLNNMGKQKQEGTSTWAYVSNMVSNLGCATIIIIFLLMLSCERWMPYIFNKKPEIILEKGLKAEEKDNKIYVTRER